MRVARSSVSYGTATRRIPGLDIASCGGDALIPEAHGGFVVPPCCGRLHLTLVGEVSAGQRFDFRFGREEHGGGCPFIGRAHPCLLYTSDAADDLLCVDLGGRRI